MNLYVVLDEESVRKWEEIKKFLGKKDDTETMRVLVESFLNLVEGIKGNEEGESQNESAKRDRIEQCVSKHR